MVISDKDYQAIAEFDDSSLKVVPNPKAGDKWDISYSYRWRETVDWSSLSDYTFGDKSMGKPLPPMYLNMHDTVRYFDNESYASVPDAATSD